MSITSDEHGLKTLHNKNRRVQVRVLSHVLTKTLERTQIRVQNAMTSFAIYYEFCGRLLGQFDFCTSH